MIKCKTRFEKLLLSFFLLFSITASAQLYRPETFYHPVHPKENIHPRLSFLIAKRLEFQHYTGLKLNDELSSEVFDSFIKALDPQHSIFMQKDINEFNKFRYFIDDAYERGLLDPAFFIFNLYQQRTAQRLVYMLNTVEKDYDDLRFDVDEFLQTDRENSRWLSNPQQLRMLWKKQLKNIIIGMRLNDKTDKEIRETLSKRFKVQLNRLKQTKSEDAFRIYVNALAEMYDPHTQYFSPRVSENFNIQMKLSLEGIGAILQEDEGYTKIKRLIPGGPADKSGLLKAGDRIVGVAQEKQKQFVDVVGWRLDDVVQLIRGKKGTRVRLRIIPHKETNEHNVREVEIVRNTVNLEEQSAHKEIIEIQRGEKKYKLGVINLPTFYIDFEGAKNNTDNYRSTTRDVKRILLELKKEKVDGIILDLRNNGGGSLREVNTLLGLFIKPGPTVLIKSADNTISALANEENQVVYTGPLAVLVNRLSASASEIFAGAIQDYQRGIVIGGQTFGKGTVQALQPLTHGQLKITHAKFYRISGDSTQNLGIIPDIAFPPIYDKDEIGESALPEALKWDQIDPVEYRPYAAIHQYLPQLISQHEKRTENNPDFIYLRKSLKRIQKLKDRTRVSLNEQVRRKEFEQQQLQALKLENERRKAKGKPVYASVKEMKQALEKEEEENAAKAEHDIQSDESRAYLIEAGEILLDLLQLKTA